MGSMPPVKHPYFLTRRQWLQQILSGTTSDFGPTPNRRGEVLSSFDAIQWDVYEDADNFIRQSDDTCQECFPIEVDVLDYEDASEFAARFNFRYVLRKVGRTLGYNLEMCPVEECLPMDITRSRSSPRHAENASQQALMMASSSVQSFDYGVSVSGRQFLVVEMKRPVVFRRSASSAIPSLCSALLEASKPSPPIATVVSVEPLFQLYRYMQGMKLAYGIISSFDLMFLVRRGGDIGDTLYISEGIPNTSPRFLGALAYMVDKAFKEPILFKSAPDMKHVEGGSSQASVLGIPQSKGSQGKSRDHEEKKRKKTKA